MSHSTSVRGGFPLSRSTFWTLVITGTLIWPAGAAIAIATSLAAGAWLAAAGLSLVAIGMIAGFTGTLGQPADA